MFSFWGRDLKSALNETRLVNIRGVRFRLKKIDPFSYMDGSGAISQIFQTYEQKREISEPNMNKIKDHYRDVILAGVVEPKIVRKQEEAINKAIFVDNLFTDWGLANSLYQEIMEYTYGKKKTLFT